MRKIEQRATARKHSESPVQKVSPTGADQARLISTLHALRRVLKQLGKSSPPLRCVEMMQLEGDGR